jgi:hydroxypyruvate isomerase
MLRFSANIGFMWPGLALEQRITAAGKAGFRAVEMHWPYDSPAGSVRRTCQASGLEVVSINTSPGDLKKGEAGLGALAGREVDFQTAIDEAISYSAVIGASAIHAMAGVVPYDDEARAVLVGNLQEAADKAARHDLVILCEGINQRNMPGYFYSTCEQVADVIERTQRDNVRMMFDIYHVAISQGDVLTRLRSFFPMIGHIQIAAVPSRQEPDEGEIDYRVVLGAVEEAGYDGWIGCEYHPRGDTDAGLTWVKQLGFAL